MVIPACSGILLSSEKERATDTSTDDARKHCAQETQTDSKGRTLYGSIYITFLERQTDGQETSLVVAGVGEKACL